MIKIPLTGKKHPGLVALIDDEDYELVSQYSWYAAQFTNNRVLYAQASARREDGVWTTIKMHKLITGYAQTDHKDLNGLNNQRYNLRAATSSQNKGNQRGRRLTSSQFKGVYQRSGAEKWDAQIVRRGRNTHLGSFADEKEAALAYNQAAAEYYGEFAHLNQIEVAA